jgi:hypothetical protein
MTKPLLKFLADLSNATSRELKLLLPGIGGYKFLKFGIQIIQAFFRVRLLLRHHLDVIADGGDVMRNLPDISVDR